MLLLFIALLFLVCSLLIFFDLQYPILWKISIGATEYGHWFVLAPLSIAFLCRFQNTLSGTTTVISLITAAIFLFPHFSAMNLSRSLPARIEQSFGKATVGKEMGEAFHWSRLWFGPSPAASVPIREVYAHNGGEEQYLLFFR